MDVQPQRLPFDGRYTGSSIFLMFSGVAVLVGGLITGLSLMPQNTYGDQSSSAFAYGTMGAAVVTSSVLFGLAGIVNNLNVLRLIACGAIDPAMAITKED